MIDTKNFFFPKPAHKAGAVKLSAYRYKIWKKKVWAKQGERCQNCRHKIPLEESQLHHYQGRGLGGGKRDDRKTFVLCMECHLKEHGARF